MPIPTRFAVVLSTCGSREEADLIATRLVENRLAACVQIFPIASVYRWEGEVQKAEEWLLLCKIDRAAYASVEAEIRTLHSYANPEIIEIGIEEGAPAYLDWIASVTDT